MISTQNWTNEQKQAIDATSRTILVSAAAGSGKTSVLVQRVINKIIDKKNPVDINKLLIVTFTNSAAQEMKTRISQKLSELIQENPEDLNLQRQKMLLKYAQIGTIHGFCNNIIKENFFKIGISPNFKIASQSEILILKQKALENTLNFFFEQENPKFISILDLFSNEKGDINKLKNIILDIYFFTESIIFPEKWFEKQLKLYEKYINQDNNKITVWQKYILKKSEQDFKYILDILSECIEIIKSSEELQKSYLTCFEQDFELLFYINNLLNNCLWDELVIQISNFNFTRLKVCKSKDCEYEKEIIISKRNKIKDIINDLKKCFSWTQIEINNDVKNLYSHLEMIFNIVICFNKELKKLKFEKNILSFSDLENLCLELLIDENSQKSDIAHEISSCYDEIMIDEYQDINEVQDNIFKFISRNEKNIFMVGDVKQSIYGFRQSKPEIFLDKKNKYKIYNNNSEQFSKINLSKNFRSNKNIIDSINFIFENLMSKQVGDIDYNQEEKLFFGLNNTNNVLNRDTCFNINLIDSSELEDKESEIKAEARETAKIISNLVNNKQNNYKDFCILLRNIKKNINIYVKELENFGIPVSAETTEKFLTTSEISTIMSILKIINNPIDDIELVAVMLNPVFGFTMDELSEIRAYSRDTYMYFALKKYYESHENVNKLQNFVKKIEYYRKIGTNMTCDEIIDYIYTDTNILQIYCDFNNGKLRKANLLLFRDYARDFVKENQKSLCDFLEYINNIQEQDDDLPPATVPVDSENSVKIMSIHKSKGLEFPVCILSGVSDKFVQDHNSILIHNELGIGMKLKNNKLNFVYDNIIRKTISLILQNENISEELRVFYVALTRSKNKIYIVSCINNIDRIFNQKTHNNNLIYNYEIQNASSFLDWILLCVTKRLNNITNITQNKYIINISENLNWGIELTKPDNINKNYDYNKNICELNTEKTTEYVYPFGNCDEIPVRVTASQISQKNNWYENIASTYPDFMSHKNAPVTAYGTAMHKFMCYCNLDNINKNLDLEINKLVELGFLKDNEDKFLNKINIRNFTNSNLYNRIINSKKILREYKFSVKIPVKNIKYFNNILNYKNSDQEIIVQGAIDCVFLENNNFVIIDYKTDKISNKQDILDKYLPQLELYKLAFEQIQNLKVTEIGIYSFYNSEYYYIKFP